MPEYEKKAEANADNDGSNPNGYNQVSQIDTKSNMDPSVKGDMDAYQELLNQENEGGHHNVDLNELFIH